MRRKDIVEWKKPTCALLVAMLIFGVAMVGVSADPQTPKLFVDPPTYTAYVMGEVFTINVNIANVTNLGGFDFALGYNTTLLDALDAVQGPFPQPPVSFNKQIIDTEGYVYISIICSPSEGNGTLATITFKATYLGSASCKLDLYQTSLYDPYGNPITHNVEDGNYNFVALNITVATDKPLYYQGGNVTIHGNLTLEGAPYEGLVAIEVDDRNVTPIVVRTLQTGAPPPPGNVTIVDVYPCDMYGNPKQSFARGETPFFNVSVRNDGNTSVSLTITINVYDKNMVQIDKFGAAAVQMPLAQGTGYAILSTFTIPEWAAIGNGTAYANVLTNWPRDGGVPYCPEKNKTFQITDGSPGGGSSQTPSSQNFGNYSLTFNLTKFGIALGNYTVYATSSYRGQPYIANTPFETKLYGDVNGNGAVTGGDIIRISLHLGTVVGHPNYDPASDVDGDGRIIGGDIIKTSMHLGEYGY